MLITLTKRQGRRAGRLILLALCPCILEFIPIRSICDSRWVSRPAHRCSRTGLESFPSPGSSAMRPLSWGPMRGLEPPSGLVTCGFAPPPCGASLPHAVAWVSRVSSVPPSDHLHITGPTSASPGHDPRRWLLRASSSPAASGWHLLRQVTGLPESRWGLRRSPSPWVEP